MAQIRLAMVEARFADIVWENAPLSTKELITLCAEALNWKRTTTYTVLKKLCERGIFKMEDSMVTVLIDKEEFRSRQSENFVQDNFSGSLPAFLAAFSARKKLSQEEIKQVREMLDSYEEK